MVAHSGMAEITGAFESPRSQAAEFDSSMLELSLPLEKDRTRPTTRYSPCDSSFSKPRTESEMGETKFEKRDVKTGMFVPRLVA